MAFAWVLMSWTTRDRMRPRFGEGVGGEEEIVAGAQVKMNLARGDQLGDFEEERLSLIHI